jgi:regulator of protease activity HflC (stomatin/prohibitin superfamily)
MCIDHMDAGIIEYLGEFKRVAPSGFTFLCWPLENIIHVISLKTNEARITCDTKTKDNVFVQVRVSVMYKVSGQNVHNAYYKLNDPIAQIQSYVFDVIRSSVPRLELDDAFASKADVAEAVKNQLSTLMTEYGYTIVDCLITDLEPDPMVKRAMNQINAEQRKREAASYQADAQKILAVKSAEADAESKYLAGLGVARQRKAVVDGLKESVTEFTTNVSGSSSSDVMDLLLVTQYFDALRDVGKVPGSSNTLFLPHGPQAVSKLRRTLDDTFMANLTKLGKY